ncbi:MAG: HNH endonuclease [Chloroflexi bacterium]|nr:MAG: HNH endonuclease [Chloroflexota bacterium]
MTHVPTELRREVIERAGNCCEYCRIQQDDYFFTFEIDHIIAEKHRGKTTSDNLCLSCPDCNAYKGSDIASLDPETNELTMLFHPRKHNWSDHFKLNGVRIEPLTAVGRVTEFLLRFNMIERVIDRELFGSVGHYPCNS